MLDAWLDGVLGLIEQGGAVMPALVLAGLAQWFGLTDRALTLARFDARAVTQRLAPLATLDRPRREEAARLALADLHAGLGRYRGLVQSLAFAAPLLGLLGTVGGMIETFDSLGQQAMFRQSGGIAGGIAEALLTTQLGLCIAIPGTLLGRMLERREDRLHARIDEIADRLVRGLEAPCAA